MLVFVFVCRLHNSGALSFSYLGHWQKRSLLWQLRPCMHLLSINTGPLNATSFYFCISMYFCICIANKAHAAPVLRQHNICTHPDTVALKVKPNISSTYSFFPFGGFIVDIFVNMLMEENCFIVFYFKMQRAKENYTFYWLLWFFQYKRSALLLHSTTTLCNFCCCLDFCSDPNCKT